MKFLKTETGKRISRRVAVTQDVSRGERKMVTACCQCETAHEMHGGSIARRSGVDDVHHGRIVAQKLH